MHKFAHLARQVTTSGAGTTYLHKFAHFARQVTTSGAGTTCTQHTYYPDTEARALTLRHITYITSNTYIISSINNIPENLA